MGMEGRLYAVGQYRKGLEKALQMDPRDDSPEGSRILQSCGECLGSISTRELMAALGIPNFRLKDMHLTAERVLSRYGDLLVFDQDHPHTIELDRIEALANANFDFFFDPYG